MTGPFSVDFDAPAELRKWPSLNISVALIERHTWSLPDRSINAYWSSWLSQSQRDTCMRFLFPKAAAGNGRPLA